METTNVDFHSLPRRDLQALCKKHKIPANMTNVAMADALKALFAAEEVEKREQESPKKVEAPRGTASQRAARSSRRGAAKGEEKEIDGIPLVELPDTPAQPAGGKTRAREAPKADEEEGCTARSAAARSRPRKVVSFAVSEQEPGESRFPKEVRKTPVASRARSVDEKEKSAGFGSRRGTARLSSSRKDVPLAAEATASAASSRRTKRSSIGKMVDLSELEKPEEGMESGVGEEQKQAAVEPELSDSVLTQENGRPDDGDVRFIGPSGLAESAMVEEPEANVPSAVSDDGDPVEAAHEEGEEEEEEEEEEVSAVEADPGNVEELPAPDIPVVAAEEMVAEDPSPLEVPGAEQMINEAEPQRASGDEEASYPIADDHMEEEVDMKQSDVEEPIILPEAQGILEFEDVVLEAHPLGDETPLDLMAEEDKEEVLEAQPLGDETPVDLMAEKEEKEAAEDKEEVLEAQPLGNEIPVDLMAEKEAAEDKEEVLEAQPLGDEIPVDLMAEEEENEAAENIEEVLEAELLGEGNPVDLVDEKHIEVEAAEEDIKEEHPEDEKSIFPSEHAKEEEALEDTEEVLEAELLGEGNQADLVDEKHDEEVEATEDMEEEHAGDFIVDLQSVFPSEHAKEEAAEEMEEVLEAELLGEGNPVDFIAKERGVEEEAAEDMEDDAEEQSFPEDSSPLAVKECEEEQATLVIEVENPHSFSAPPLPDESDHIEIEDAAVSGALLESAESDSEDMAEEQDAPAPIGVVATVGEVPSLLPMEMALPTTPIASADDGSNLLETGEAEHPVQMDEQQIGEEDSLPPAISVDQEQMVKEEATEEAAAEAEELKEPPSESTFQMQEAEDGAVAPLPEEITIDASESVANATVNCTIEAPAAEKEEEFQLALVTPMKKFDDNSIAADKVRFSAKRSVAIPLSDFKENGGVMYGSGIKHATTAKQSRPTREEMQGWSMRRLRKQLQELTLGDNKKTNEDNNNNNSKVSTNQSEGRLALGTLNSNCLGTYPGF